MTIIELGAPGPVAEPGPGLLPSADLIIDGSDEPLFRITTAFGLPDGSVAVLDGGESALRTFGDDGREIRRYGRAGDGPGEFRDVTAAGLLTHDSAWVFDFLASRITVFDLASGRSRIIRVETDIPFRTVLGVADDRFLLVGSALVTGATAGGLHRDSVALATVPVASGPPRKIGVTTADEQLVEVVTSADGIQTRKSRMPFSYSTRHAVVDDLLVTVYTERYELELSSADGALRRVLRVRISPRAVDDALIGRLAVFEAEEMGDPGRAGAIRRAIEDMSLHSTAPVVRDIVAGGEGYPPSEVWVGLAPAPADTTMTWLAHDTSGAVIASAVLPVGFRMTDVTGGHFIGVRVDELGVERVFRLRRFP